MLAEVIISNFPLSPVSCLLSPVSWVQLVRSGEDNTMTHCLSPHSSPLTGLSDQMSSSLHSSPVQAVFLTGVQLLTVDEKIPGPTRERLLVSYYRYSGQAAHNSHVDTVCELLRSSLLRSHWSISDDVLLSLDGSCS